MCSSSGEDSDNSHASRGCLGPQEAADIERSMLAALRQWETWAGAEVNGAASSSSLGSTGDTFGLSFMRLFSDQDDALIEAMLCLVDIHVAMGEH